VGTFELIVILMAAVVVLVWLADRVKIPYPMLLMLGGLALAILPWGPNIELEPEIVLVIFLPPILFQAAQLTSWREFTNNFGPISRLAFGLVLVTTGVVAVAAHAVIPEIGWPAAFVLGAIVSPPDAVAATAIFQRLGAPRRIVTILEGESLINDASALVVYTFAVAAVVTGKFSAVDALIEFVLVVVIGVAVGAVIGLVLGRVLMVLGDPSLVTIVTLLAPAGAYVLGEHLGGSGVLAVVVAGLMHGFNSPQTMTPTARVRSLAVWDFATICINGLIFILIGFELGALREEFSAEDIGEIILYSLVVLVAMTAARFAYVFVGQVIPHKRWKQPERQAFGGLGTRSQFLIAWSGLRGVVSLATALALPYITDAGTPFDHRDQIVLIAAVVIVCSLFGFGLPLPWILRKLKLVDDGAYEYELNLARKVVRRAMYDTMKAEMEHDPKMADLLSPMLKEMEARSERVANIAESSTAEQIHDIMQPRILARQRAIDAARAELIELRDREVIGDEVRREVERSLDLQELQFST